MSVVRLDFERTRVRRRNSGLAAPAVKRGMGQGAVGAFAAHRIAAPPRHIPRISSAGRRAMVLLGAVVLMASIAGMLLGRVLASV
jgi:hypothetical protein